MKAGGALLAGTVLALLAASRPAAAAEIVDLVAVVKEETIVVSFRVENAFSEDIERAIESGLPVSFRYTVELRKERPLWPNKRLATRRIETTVTYDNLTGRYKLARSVDGELERTRIVSDADGMRRFMTEVEPLGLFDRRLLEPNGEYTVRVRGVMKDRNLFLFIPWDIGADWKQARFTYVP